MIKSMRMKWAGHVARMGGEEECIWDIGGKARKKQTTRKNKTKWVDNIKMDLREIG
jgi:hypothetical protein